jgi:hypothetical protein
MEGQEFIGRLIDEDDSESTYSLDEVSMDDRSLVVPGAIFDLSIGYRQDEGGTRTRVSRLVFRRLPAWSKERIHPIVLFSSLQEGSDRITGLAGSTG